MAEWDAPTRKAQIDLMVRLPTLERRSMASLEVALGSR